MTQHPPTYEALVEEHGFDPLDLLIDIEEVRSWDNQVLWCRESSPSSRAGAWMRGLS